MVSVAFVPVKWPSLASPPPEGCPKSKYELLGQIFGLKYKI